MRDLVFAVDIRKLFRLFFEKKLKNLLQFVLFFFFCKTFWIMRSYFADFK